MRTEKTVSEGEQVEASDSQHLAKLEIRIHYSQMIVNVANKHEEYGILRGIKKTETNSRDDR